MDDGKTKEASDESVAEKKTARPKPVSGETERHPERPGEEPESSDLPADALDESAIRALFVHLQQAVIQVFESKFPVVPWPDPETMAGYKEIDPEFPRVIVDEFREQGRHEREMDRSRTKANIVATFIGLGAGFLIAIAGLTGAVIVGLYGAWQVGVALAGGTLVGLASVFVYGSRYAAKALDARPEKGKSETLPPENANGLNE